MRTATTWPRLGKGETVGVVATGYAVERGPLDAGLDRLGRMGYRVRLGANVRKRDGYLAGTDDARAADLLSMLADDSVRAIWFARGGYGTARLLDRVPWSRLRRNPRLLIGYSDLTALFNPVVQRAGQVCIYGPVVTELSDRTAYHAPSLKALLAGGPLEFRLRPRQLLAPGRCRGRLLGGNLSVLTHLWGTRFAPDLAGSVLLLEDWGEQTYSIDRMLTQLRLSGSLARLAGVLVGQLRAQPRKNFPPDRSLEQVLRENFEPLGIPVVTGIPAGHMAGKRSLPLGARAEIDTGARRVRFS